MIDGEFWVYRLHEVHRELITLEDGADDKSALSLVRCGTVYMYSYTALAMVQG